MKERYEVTVVLWKVFEDENGQEVDRHHVHEVVPSQNFIKVVGNEDEMRAKLDAMEKI
jgi:hypothetical protein